MKLSPSLITSWVIAIILVFTVLNSAKWKDRSVMRYDMFEYYAYLPAAIIFHDLEFDFIYTTPGDDKRQIPLFKAPNGGLVLKMTMGVALMELPFFLLGHATALLTGENANGYTWMYHLFMAISFLLYAIVAIFLQRKLLLKYFTEGAVSLSLLAIFLGTNYFYYATYEGAMSHVYSFFLFTVFITQSIKWFESFKWYNALFTGLSFGLIVLIRPVNAIVILVPLLFGVRFFAQFMVRLQDVFAHYFQLLLVVIMVGLVLLPQLVYWHEITGNWIYYSYTDEGFFFNDPRIIEGLFGFRKGWLIYTPVAVFSLLGMLVLWVTKTASKYRLAIPVYLILHIYIIFSWWCWWYGGGYSARPMIETMAVLSIPMAAIFTVLLSKRNTAIFTTLFVFALIGLNQFQTYQYTLGIVHYDSMSKETYKMVFAKDYYPPGYDETLKTPDYDAAKKGDRKE